MIRFLSLTYNSDPSFLKFISHDLRCDSLLKKNGYMQA